jgi:hypothetical protein
VNCDAIAPYYAAMEYAVFGRTLERCRSSFLPQLAGARYALVLGDGDGRFLRRLLAECRGLRADYVDCSAAMTALARSAAGSERVAYYCSDALAGNLPGSGYDLVVTHFFLDCFDGPQMAALVDRVKRAAPGARWLVSEFRIPQSRWLAGPGRAFIRLLYAFFTMSTGLSTRSLVDHRPLLQRAGFQPLGMKPRAGGLLVSELWEREPLE